MSIEESVKDKVRVEGGLSSNDVSSFVRKDPDTPAPDPDAPTVAEIDDQVRSRTQTVDRGAQTESEEVTRKLLLGTAQESQFDELMQKFQGMDEVIITQEDKDTFLEALVTGERWCRSLSLFNGRLPIVLRSRTNAETRAMHNEVQRRAAAGEYQTVTDMQGVMRLVSLRFHLQEIQGVEYQPPEAPLLAQIDTVRNSAGKVVAVNVAAPGWYDEMMNFYNELPEAVVTSIYKEIREFEYKYWTMTLNCSDQNFWNPDSSTSD
jgi:hypothetical protein